MLAGIPHLNQAVSYPRKAGTSRIDSAASTAWIRAQRFDLAVLLPNSLRSAMMVFRAGVPRRVGYAREGRSLLLTDRLIPLARTPEERRLSKLRAAARNAIAADLKQPRTLHLKLAVPRQPVPTIDYYLALATYLGARQANRQMELAITPEEQAEATQFLRAAGLSGKPLVVMVPGANFGSSKCWPAEHFAAVAATLAALPYRAHTLLASSPAERPIIDAIMTAIADRMPKGQPPCATALYPHKLSLGALKPLVQQAKMMICNDTGPRHFAAALGTPTVTIFGPTDPRWAETFFEKERQVSIPVPCGPCQLKKCPIDHRCLTQLEPAMVLEAVSRLWAG